MKSIVKSGKFEFDKEAYWKICDSNSKKVVDNVYGTAVTLAINAKYGIIRGAMVPESDRAAVREAMAPLIPILEREAIMSVMRVFDGMLGHPGLLEYLQKTTASNIGKNGGRKPRSKMPHMDWLEATMRHNQMQHPHVHLTAKEHRRLLLSHSDILREEKNNLIFCDKVLDRFEGNGDVFITENAIAKMLTRIKKNPI